MRARVLGREAGSGCGRRWRGLRRAAGALKRAAVGVVAAQALRAAPDRVLAGEVAPDRDAQPRAAAPPGLLGDLQGDPREAHDVVATHEPLAVLGQELIEVHRVAQGDEGAGGISGRVGELGVVIGDELIAQVGVGRLERSDSGHAELVHETALESAVQALDPAAGLRRIARDVLDAEASQDPADDSDGSDRRGPRPRACGRPSRRVGVQRHGNSKLRGRPAGCEHCLGRLRGQSCA